MVEYITQAARYVPSIDGWEPSLEYSAENEVDTSVAFWPDSSTTLWMYMNASPTGAMYVGRFVVVMFSLYIS